MSEPLILSAGVMMGLFSAPHCLAMCGGLVSAFGMGTGANNWSARAALVVKLNLGRLLSYGALGLIAGLIGGFAFDYVPQAQLILRLLAGSLLILCGFYIGGWWLGLRYVESFIGRLTQKLANLGNLSPKAGFYAGLSWGCLPCGLVYSALSIALTQQSALSGALFMLSFGLGTLPALISVGMMSSALTTVLKNQWVRHVCGGLMLSYGTWTILSAALMSLNGSFA